MTAQNGNIRLLLKLVLAAAVVVAVVVVTMFAAMSFDPRLIWDPLTDSALRRPDHD